jgi:phosphonopyruvate decarboxylase
MHMGALAVIGHSGPPNLVHVLINNGSHDSVGGQPTVGYDIDIPAIALACGYRQAVCVTTANEAQEQVTRLREAAGPVLLEIKVNKGARSDLGRPKSTPLQNRDALMRRLGL